MPEKGKRRNRREEMLKAGIEEINQYGLAGFSVRRIAESCGVSCAAPAKHFGDRRGFIAAIIEYVNGQWRARQETLVAQYRDDTRRLLVELSVAYVQFLVENPHFRSILMLKDDEFDNVYHKVRGELSSLTQQLVQRYCAEVGMDEDTRMRKLYVIRALIFGAALLFDNGELPYNGHTIEFVRTSIEREFDLA